MKGNLHVLRHKYKNSLYEESSPEIQNEHKLGHKGQILLFELCVVHTPEHNFGDSNFGDID